MLNKVALLDKAQIGLDSLQKQDRLRVIKTIESLVNFPSNPSLQVHKLRLKENYFLARAGLKYRVIFQHQDNEITISDIVNHDRLESLYGSRIKKESLVETA
jgi:mRNA-degrading endonuclease RelE of RelBE toxin-antitoxin system